MAFRISEIGSAINKYKGIHKPSHFMVRITPPSFLSSDQYVRDIELMCEATTLPGLHLDSQQVRPMGYGTTESRPTDYSVPQVRCDFFVDNVGSMLSFFQKWIGNINNFGPDIKNASDATKLNYYEFAYPEEYEGTVVITLFDSTGSKILNCTLHQAFPITIGDLSLAWEMNDQISRLPITFAYNSWSTSVLPYHTAAREVGVKVTIPSSNLPAGQPATELPIPKGQPGLPPDFGRFNQNSPF